jgi:sporulation protein YlmC with PRC-barrel domain
MEDVPMNAPVECADGPSGEIACVIVDPTSYKITNLVIGDVNLPGDAKTRLVPGANVSDVKRRKVRLSCTRADLADMPPFMETHFIRQSPEGRAFAHRSAYQARYIVNSNTYATVRSGGIPDDDFALYGGMQVEASDGKVGTLDELVLDVKSGEVTGLRIRHGRLWGAREILIPVTDIDLVDAQTVYLKTDKATVGSLPGVKPD